MTPELRWLEVGAPTGIGQVSTGRGCQFNFLKGKDHANLLYRR